jgi:DNA-binding protein HU-beta
LTKQDFIGKVAQKSGLSSRDATKAVDAFLESITEALRGGDDVAFTGFGKFSTQRRAERQGVNPRNPTQKVTIPAATVPKFSAGSQLKQAVKSGGAGAGGESTGGSSTEGSSESTSGSTGDGGYGG